MLHTKHRCHLVVDGKYGFRLDVGIEYNLASMKNLLFLTDIDSDLEEYLTSHLMNSR